MLMIVHELEAGHPKITCWLRWRAAIGVMQSTCNVVNSHQLKVITMC